MPSSYKPYIHRNICLYKQNKTTLLQGTSVEVFGGNHDRNKMRSKGIGVASKSSLFRSFMQHHHLYSTFNKVLAVHRSSHDFWTPFLYRGRFL